MRQVEQYWRKFSAPLLDRIDLRVPVFPSESAGHPGPASTTTSELRVDIARAVATQRRRQGKRNRFLLPEEVGSYCILTSGVEAFLDHAGIEYGFSARGRVACTKIARTIADMAGNDTITMPHMEEAVLFRKSDGVLSFDF
jgi:magnesium chelatase family protein